jgi:hypothetical protein
MIRRTAAQGAYSAAKEDHVERLPCDVTFTGVAPTTRRKFKPHGPFTSTAAIFGVEVDLNQMCAGVRRSCRHIAESARLRRLRGPCGYFG